MSDTQQPDAAAQVDPKAELTARQQSQKIGIARQHEQVAERKYNPGFYEETAKLDADTDLYDWLENELGAKGSKSHVLGNRPEEFAEQQMLLNRNQAERMIAEREPGYLLKKNPVVLAVYQGLDPLAHRDNSIDNWDPLLDEDAVTPIEVDGVRRQYRDLAELVTTRETLAIEGRYVDALTTATTETSHRDRVQDEASGTTKRLRSVFR